MIIDVHQAQTSEKRFVSPKQDNNNRCKYV